MMPDDLQAKAARYIGAPYLTHGRDPSGWDCKGCVSWFRREEGGRRSPALEDDWSHVGVPGMTRALELMRENLVRGLEAWTPVEPRPWAVVLLKVFGAPGHVGVMLTPRTFLHCEVMGLTSVGKLGSPRWPMERVVGFYDAV